MKNSVRCFMSHQAVVSQSNGHFYAAFKKKSLSSLDLVKSYKLCAKLNPHWHELWKQEKCSSLVPPRGIFNKTWWAWQGVKLNRLMSIFTSKKVSIKILKKISWQNLIRKVPSLMPIRVNGVQRIYNSAWNYTFFGRSLHCVPELVMCGCRLEAAVVGCFKLAKHFKSKKLHVYKHFMILRVNKNNHFTNILAFLCPSKASQSFSWPLMNAKNLSCHITSKMKFNHYVTDMKRFIKNATIIKKSKTEVVAVYNLHQ